MKVASKLDIDGRHSKADLEARIKNLMLCCHMLYEHRQDFAKK